MADSWIIIVAAVILFVAIVSADSAGRGSPHSHLPARHLDATHCGSD